MQSNAQQALNEAQENEKKSLFWEAAQKYQEALLEFNKTSGNESEKGLCKKKIREMNVEKSKEFVKSSFTSKFTEGEQNEIEKQINFITDINDVSELLDKIGKNPNFCPSFQEVKQRAEKTMPVSFQITNITVQDENGDQIKDGNNPDIVWFYQNYSFSQNFTILIYLLPIFNKIMDEKLTIQNLSDYFKSKGIFKEDFLKILDVAIERFFNGDYISTLHILVPKFEKVFLDLTQAIGKNADIIASRTQKGEKDKVWTQDKTLGEDFLKNEDVRNIWSENFCEQIIFVFLSQLGYKLRHKIAHGYSKLDELNFQNSVLVFYFYLVLAVRIKKAEK
jgi:hypothetical protein